ncbi:DUF4145 domain-containing protein [Vibrio sp. 10N.222.49.C9]|uniref:DUF4145 domain-containing protein n=1 Tax=Vibrio sp. 10N.222.49.C9 TaxID=3229615 RepID=UPI00355094B1
MERFEQYQDALESIEHYAVQNEFSKLYSETYRCPNCRSNSLGVDWSSINLWHTRKSQQSMDESREESLAWVEEESELQFVGRLRCECGEVVAISGDATYQKEIVDDNGSQIQYLDEKYYIRYFSRAIQSFYAPNKTPSQCVEILEEAFLLFHINPSASGNRLRVLLELVVDDLLGSDGDNIKDLNGKIGKLGSKMPDLKYLADLKRKLGNRASHKKGLSHASLTSAFYFMDHLLNRAYGEEFDMLRFSQSKTVT